MFHAGIQTRIDGKVQSFEITPAPSVTTIQDTGWVQLLISPSEKKHILCMSMPTAKNSALKFIQVVSESRCTVAVLIINIHAIALVDWSAFGDLEMPNIPLFIVTSAVGRDIMEMVKKHCPIEARIEGSNVAPVPKPKRMSLHNNFVYSNVVIHSMLYDIGHDS